MKNAPVIKLSSDSLYYLAEYDKAVDYAKTYINIDGVKEQLQILEKCLIEYKNSVDEIMEPQWEDVRKKYARWENWSKAKKICKYVSIAIFILFLLLMFRGGSSTAVMVMLLLLPVLLVLSLVGLAITKIAETILSKAYNNYIKDIFDKINSLGTSFGRQSRLIYNNIDNLYLQSLDPMQRSLIITQRQMAEMQKKHDSEIRRLEEQRQRSDNKRLQEARRTRIAQERLLEIEEERERRYRRY